MDFNGTSVILLLLLLINTCSLDFILLTKLIITGIVLPVTFRKVMNYFTNHKLLHHFTFALLCNTACGAVVKGLLIIVIAPHNCNEDKHTNYFVLSIKTMTIKNMYLNIF